MNILITGAGSGIGKDTAHELASAGHHIIATDKTLEDLQALQAEAAQSDYSIEYIALDLAQPETWTIDYASVDILINNGAIGESGPLVEIPMKRVRNNMNVNVLGTLELTQRVATNMAQRGAGRVIIVGSTAGLVTLPYLGSYTMTKYALEAASDALRMELAQFGVHVSLIEPGKIDTGFNQRMTQTKYSWLDNNSLYASSIEQMKTADATFFSNESSTAPVVRAIVHACTATRPKARYIAPRSIAPSIYLAGLLPSRLRDAIVTRMTGYISK